MSLLKFCTICSRKSAVGLPVSPYPPPPSPPPHRQQITQNASWLSDLYCWNSTVVSGPTALALVCGDLSLYTHARTHARTHERTHARTHTHTHTHTVTKVRGRQKKCWMDNVKEWTSLPMPGLLTMVSRRQDWKRISAESSLIYP